MRKILTVMFNIVCKFSYISKEKKSFADRSNNVCLVITEMCYFYRHISMTLPACFRKSTTRPDFEHQNLYAISGTKHKTHMITFSSHSDHTQYFIINFIYRKCLLIKRIKTDLHIVYREILVMMRIETLSNETS